jgi:hypothetical protein
MKPSRTPLLIRDQESACNVAEWCCLRCPETVPLGALHCGYLLGTFRSSALYAYIVVHWQPGITASIPLR